MKFSCSSSELVNAVSTASRVMAVRSPKEALEGVLLEAEQDTLKVTASDGNMISITCMSAVIEEPGSVIIPGKLLGDVVRRLPNGTVNASMKDKTLTLRCGVSRISISGREAEDFPMPEEGGFEYEISLPQPMIKEIIQQISFAVPLEDQRVVLTGGFLNLSDGKLDMVGLDGFRMAVRSASVSDIQLRAKAIIPAKALGEMEKLMGDDENEMARLCFARNRVMVASGQTRLYAQLIEGEYIDYKRVIPKSFNTTVKIDRQLFTDSVDRAALIARMSKNNLIKFEISQGLMVISAVSDMGDAREELECETEGPELAISFNVKYLTEFARVSAGEELTMRFGNAISPCVITQGDGEFIYLVLPVRTNAQ